MKDGALLISSTQHIDAGALISAASLLFGPGDRPWAEAIAEHAEKSAAFSISFDPSSNADGMGGSGPTRWLELLANGLTFDLGGLSPGGPAERPPHAHSFGLPSALEIEPLEAVTLRPGPHLSGGAMMMPVVRSLACLTALLADLPGVRAIVWHPARSWCAPQYFHDSVLRWVEGGVFPTFSLAALAPTPDGGMQSEGLALFTGQELRIEPELVEDRAAGGRIGVRLLHLLAEQGRLAEPVSLTGPDGQPLRVEPSPNGRFVRVWKD